MKILYVEDNEDNVYVVQQRLGRAGYTVVVAPDGERGLVMTETEQPDLILMDLSLPGLDGWETTRRLKAAPATKHIPIIALTAHAMTGDREQCLAAGCDDYATKPIDPHELVLTIARGVASKRGVDAIDAALPTPPAEPPAQAPGGTPAEVEAKPAKSKSGRKSR